MFQLGVLTFSHGWSDWAEQGCSKTCGGGTMVRRRSCRSSSPPCRAVEVMCPGESMDTKSCNGQACCGPCLGSASICPTLFFVLCLSQGGVTVFGKFYIHYTTPAGRGPANGVVGLVSLRQLLHNVWRGHQAENPNLQGPWI
ncbi:hypothetical protein ACOMHN_037064 [Nucella lapillus]